MNNKSLSPLQRKMPTLQLSAYGGDGDHYVPIGDQKDVSNIPSKLNSIYHVNGESLESGKK